MKNGLIFLALAVLVILAIFVFSENDRDVQNYTEQHYMNEDGLIHAYPDQPESEYLSESIGLYMQYLLNVEDEEAFRQQVNLLEQQFIKTEQSPLVLWLLREDVQVNALIDDVRIISALQTAADIFNENYYNKLAQSMKVAMEEKQRVNGLYVDFRGNEPEQTANRITLSYLTLDFFSTLDHTEPTKKLLMQVKEKNSFFPEYYALESESFQYGKEVHLIDQLLIALNLHAIGIDSPKFDSWIQQEWNKQKKLYGRYLRTSGAPSVEYESLSVYAYAWEYFEAKRLTEKAIQVKRRADKLVEGKVLDDAHFFDYIHYQKMKKQP